MSIAQDLEAISEDKLEYALPDMLPEGSIFIKTTLGAQTVELWGVNRKGFNIPLDQIGPFLGELEQLCTDPNKLYRLGKEENPVEIPGSKISKVRYYLEIARDYGVDFPNYKTII